MFSLVDFYNDGRIEKMTYLPFKPRPSLKFINELRFTSPDMVIKPAEDETDLLSAATHLIPIEGLMNIHVLLSGSDRLKATPPAAPKYGTKSLAFRLKRASRNSGRSVPSL